MNLELEGKVIIVTGGASGIGAAIVEALAAENAIPVILDRKPDDGTSAHSYHQTDLTVEAEVETAITHCTNRFSKIDGLVNNAGLNDGRSLDATPDEFRQSLEVNLVSAFTLTRLVAPHLSEGSAILNIASKVAVTGQGGTSGYAASKGGLLALTREWAVDLAPRGIRVNAIIPAEVWTPQYESWIGQQEDPTARKREIEERIPFQKRMTTTTEVADTATFLLSPRSSHTTGQWLHIDGGYAHLDRAL